MLKIIIINILLIGTSIIASEPCKDAVSSTAPVETHHIGPFYSAESGKITAANYTQSWNGFSIVTSVNKHIFTGEFSIKAKRCGAADDVMKGTDIVAEATVVDILKARINAFESGMDTAATGVSFGCSSKK